MQLKKQVQRILKASQSAERKFLDSLTEDDRIREGDYEHWSAKDVLAHVNYWPSVRTEQIKTWVERGEHSPVPQFEQSNLKCYEMFADQSWDAVSEYALNAQDGLEGLLDNLDESQLTGPSPDTEERRLWELVVQVGYTHKLLHIAEFHIRRDRHSSAGRLWTEWAELVSPLDSSETWQGRVHYNAACGLALAGDKQGSISALTKSLGLQPGMKAWARRDPDLESLHDIQEFKALITTEYWWAALESKPAVEALADQFMRAFTMLRAAVEAFSEDGWLEGETNYQRPAGLALHIAQTAVIYSAIKPGDSLDDPLMQVNWEFPESSAFPDRHTFMDFLDRVEEKLAEFLIRADLLSEETHFPWTGSTKLSRALYTLRHTQHHLADMAMELQRRGLRPPDWT